MVDKIKKLSILLLSAVMFASMPAYAEENTSAPQPFIDQDGEGIDGNLRNLAGADFRNVISGSLGVEYSEYAKSNFNFTATQYHQGTNKMWLHYGQFNAPAETNDVTISTWVNMSNFIIINKDPRGTRIFSLNGASGVAATDSDFGLEVRKDGTLWLRAIVYDENGNRLGGIEKSDGKYRWPMTWSTDYKYDFAKTEPGKTEVTEADIDGFIEAVPGDGTNRWMFASATMKYDEANHKMIYNVYLNGEHVFKDVEVAWESDATPRKMKATKLETWGGVSPELKKYARLKMYNGDLSEKQIRMIYECEKGYFRDNNRPVAVSKIDFFDKNRNRVHGEYGKARYIGVSLDTDEEGTFDGILVLSMQKGTDPISYVRMTPCEVSKTSSQIYYFDISDVFIDEQWTLNVMFWESLQSLFPFANKSETPAKFSVGTIFTDSINDNVSGMWETDGNWNFDFTAETTAFNATDAVMTFPERGTDISAEIAVSDMNINDDGYFMLMVRGNPNVWFGEQCYLAGFSGQNKLAIVKRYWNNKTLTDKILAETEFSAASNTVLKVEAIDRTITLFADDTKILSVEDETMPLLFGRCGIYSSGASGGIKDFAYKKLEDTLGGNYDNLLGGGFDEDTDTLKKYYN